jgi:hypothetical protein
MPHRLSLAGRSTTNAMKLFEKLAFNAWHHQSKISKNAPNWMI